MKIKLTQCAFAVAMATMTQIAIAGSDTWFTPLTQSAPVGSPNDSNETMQPWVTPHGISQRNLISMYEAENRRASFSVGRVPGFSLPLSRQALASMWDMVAYDPTGRYIFIPHETPIMAGVSRYDRRRDKIELLAQGDGYGLQGDWSGDYAAFDPATWTPMNTLWLGEEWSGEGRILEIINPKYSAKKIKKREVEEIANVAHEGLRFSEDDHTLYFVDEWNSGSLYKFVSNKPFTLMKRGETMVGQTFVLKVDSYAGVAEDLWNEPSNIGADRTGPATWIPLTDSVGNTLAGVTDPFRNGPTIDPRGECEDPADGENTIPCKDVVRGGRAAADDVMATPYGRLEDMEVGKLTNGNEVVYFAATSESAIYSVEMTGGQSANVRVFASEADTPKNDGFAPTTAVLNSPDNLAQDAWGNIYIIEDAPNSSDTGGDIWMARDTNGDGVAESIDHFMSIRVDGSEATGMIFNPANPYEFVVAVQHPDSVSERHHPDGFGDALWVFNTKQAMKRFKGASH